MANRSTTKPTTTKRHKDKDTTVTAGSGKSALTFTLLAEMAVEKHSNPDHRNAHTAGLVDDARMALRSFFLRKDR